MLALLLLVQAASPDVIVTGKRLEDAHRACVQGRCTTLRDAQASIAMAEAEFRHGDYVKAKATLAAAIARNAKHAADAPKPVAALYEAYATVALHEGDQDAFRRGVAGQARTLRDFVPASDPARISGEIALGDMWIKLNRFDQAALTFRSVERLAQIQQQPATAMLAGMRLVWLTAAFGDRPKANRMLATLEQMPLAADPAYRTALDVLRLRIAARGAADAEIDTLVKRIGRTTGSVPALIYAPPYDTPVFRGQADAEAFRFGERNPVQLNSSDFETLGWIDVGFSIQPDGTTTDIDVLRTSKVRPDWIPLVTRQISKRRYAAIGASGEQAGLGIYRVERVTKATIYDTPINSFVRRRTASGGFRVLDLTADAANPNG